MQDKFFVTNKLHRTVECCDPPWFDMLMPCHKPEGYHRGNGGWVQDRNYTWENNKISNIPFSLKELCSHNLMHQENWGELTPDARDQIHNSTFYQEALVNHEFRLTFFEVDRDPTPWKSLHHVRQVILKCYLKDITACNQIKLAPGSLWRPLHLDKGKRRFLQQMIIHKIVQQRKGDKDTQHQSHFVIANTARECPKNRADICGEDDDIYGKLLCTFQGAEMFHPPKNGFLILGKRFSQIYGRHDDMRCDDLAVKSSACGVVCLPCVKSQCSILVFHCTCCIIRQKDTIQEISNSTFLTDPPKSLKMGSRARAVFTFKKG